ncbi:PepSY domain-containing protein [Sphingopyxis sp. KK2]|uniref:PepSY domain-containing protein n=1 Tax=Sphingopyxis sp. KK2 TaxID=1855727 RepID=UPI00097E6131|nr:PepSY domain-containing protein [Sphingopyxis sp. KK2]
MPRIFLSFIPLVLWLAACDGGGTAPPVPSDTPMVAPPVVAATPGVPDAPAGPTAVTIAGSGDRRARQIADPALLPLSRILAIARARVPGEIIDVDLDEDDDDGPEYELEILTPDGRSIEMKIDARHGRIIEVEED